MKRLLHGSRERLAHVTKPERGRKPKAGTVGMALLSGLLLTAAPDAAAKEPAPQPEKCMEGKAEDTHYKLHGKKVTIQGSAGGIYGCLVFGKDKSVTVMNTSYLAPFKLEFYPFVEKLKFKNHRNRRDGVKHKLILTIDGEKVGTTSAVRPLDFKIKGFELPPGLELGSPMSILLCGEEVCDVGRHEVSVNNMDGVVVLKTVDNVVVAPPPVAGEMISDGPKYKKPTSDKQPSEKPTVPVPSAEESEDDEPLALAPLVPPKKKPSKTAPEKQPEKPKAVEKTTPKVSPKKPEATPAKKKVSKEPLVEAKASAEEETAAPPFISLAFERVTLSNLGEHGNSGDLNDVEVLVMPQLSESLALIVGASSGINNLSADTAETGTNLRMVTGNVVAGVLFNTGEHTLFGSVYGGVSHLAPDVASKLGEPGSEYEIWGAEYGGRVGYAYGNIFGLLVQGGNNPLNPGLARLYLGLPLTWAEGVYPRLDVDARLLRLIKPNADGSLGGELSDTNVLTRANVKVPMVRLGPVVPSILAGCELSGSSEGVEADGFFGGSLTLLIGPVEFEGGYLHSINGNHVVIVKANLSH